ncbi:hypothetical protein DTO021D3_2757 [Paecilomyces variotii]|nr:hypothetical protein DTO032I3_8048 [Paecilomyces variotii]KAJ9280537.1 hypothetical protein DTO021D3_2757 [Paecilomyces variotii]KAJ9345023.1 hypothetical protein DTO027B6_2168 [Paecilomyces variotii]KAJ9347933.1 hypothetical protein DTO027B9_8695 [Paecilomyces variotii]KAJ9390167.1 hypothetical protein DTO032I4_1693 [Paecilomyces variotii]
METHLAELFARQVTLNNPPPSTSPHRGNNTTFPLHSTFQYALPGTSLQSFHDSSWKSSACLGIGDGRPVAPSFGMLGQRDPERLSVSSSQSDMSEQQQSKPSQTSMMTQAVTQEGGLGQKHPSANNVNLGDRETLAADVDMDIDDGDDCDFTEEGAEPYIMSGYEALARREYELSSMKTSLPEEPTTGAPYNPAYDPVYQGHGW